MVRDRRESTQHLDQLEGEIGQRMSKLAKISDANLRVRVQENARADLGDLFDARQTQASLRNARLEQVEQNVCHERKPRRLARSRRAGMCARPRHVA